MSSAAKPKYVRKKADPDTSPKQKPIQATKAEQLKLATKRSKKDFHMSHASSSSDGVNIQSNVPNEQQQKTSNTDGGTGTIPGVPDVPTYKFKSEKESWGDSEDEDDNYDDGIKDTLTLGLKRSHLDRTKENDLKWDQRHLDLRAKMISFGSYKGERSQVLINPNSDNDDDGDSDDDNDDSDDEMTESDRDEIPDPKKTNEEHNEEEEEYDDEFNIEEEENIDDEETMYDDDEDEVTKEYSSVSSDFTSKLLNLENPSLADNEIASLMETSARHATTVLENTSGFNTTIPPPPLFFNPLLQQATPTPTLITSEATTSFPSLLDFAYVFKFNERVFNLEKDVSEIKQVDQYAQAFSSIPAIVDCYMDNKLGEVINKATLAHNLDYKQEDQDEKNAYIDIIDSSMRALIKEEVNTQLP
ncbi:hypothetical protein Tco_0077276 [Tanacetum coccineum]